MNIRQQYRALHAPVLGVATAEFEENLTDAQSPSRCE
jgi:hypothetical protein